MSLQVWLPLNGNLNNQGLAGDSQSTATGNFVNGKMGTCLKTSNTSTINLNYKPDLNTESVSYGGWFKFNQDEIASIVEALTYDASKSQNAATGNLIGNASYRDTGLIWITNNIRTEQTLSFIKVFGYLRTPNLGQKITSQIAIPFNTWVHLFVVYDKSKNTIQLFINGEMRTSITIASVSDAPNNQNFSINYPGVYGGNGPGSRIPFYVNDIRIYNHALSLKEIEELSKGLVVHYKLDDSEAEILDSSGYLNHGTISGGNFSVINSSPRYSRALQLSAATKITHSNVLESGTAQAWTCCAWVYPTASTGNTQLNNFNNGNRLYHQANGKALLYLNSGTNDYYIYSKTVLPLNTWTHVTFTFDNSDTSNNNRVIYFNGEENITAYGPNKTQTPGSLPTNIVIGTNFEGYISDYREYATKLSAEQVKELYEVSVSIDSKGNVYPRELVEE